MMAKGYILKCQTILSTAKREAVFIKLEFLLLDYMPTGRKSYTARCLSNSIVAKFKDVIPSAFHSMPCLKNYSKHCENLKENDVPSIWNNLAWPGTIVLKTCRKALPQCQNITHH